MTNRLLPNNYSNGRNLCVEPFLQMSLPNELVNKILTTTIDTQTLLACRRVCRQWQVCVDRLWRHYPALHININFFSDTIPSVRFLLGKEHINLDCVQITRPNNARMPLAMRHHKFDAYLTEMDTMVVDWLMPMLNIKSVSLSCTFYNPTVVAIYLNKLPITLWHALTRRRFNFNLEYVNICYNVETLPNVLQHLGKRQHSEYAAYASVNTYASVFECMTNLSRPFFAMYTHPMCHLTLNAVVHGRHEIPTVNWPCYNHLATVFNELEDKRYTHIVYYDLRTTKALLDANTSTLTHLTYKNLSEYHLHPNVDKLLACTQLKHLTCEVYKLNELQAFDLRPLNNQLESLTVSTQTQPTVTSVCEFLKCMLTQEDHLFPVLKSMTVHLNCDCDHLSPFSVGQFYHLQTFIDLFVHTPLEELTLHTFFFIHDNDRHMIRRTFINPNQLFYLTQDFVNTTRMTLVDRRCYTQPVFCRKHSNDNYFDSMILERDGVRVLFEVWSTLFRFTRV